MKVRSGFVSNSSTTSFSIYGTSLNWEDIFNVDIFKRIRDDDNEAFNLIKERLKENLKRANDLVDNYDTSKYNYYSKNHYEKRLKDVELILYVLENLDSVSEEQEKEFIKATETNYSIESAIDDFFPYEVYYEEPGYTVWVGTSISAMSDTDVYGEFKERTEKGLKEIFGDNIDIGVRSHAWRNG